MANSATCCATFSEADCVDIRDCKVNVTAGGTTFTVRRAGTAVINTVDEQGQTVQLSMHNTLISDRFPYKLLALQLFTSKGCKVKMADQSMRIVNRSTNTVFVGSKDPKTQLFFLHQAPSQAPSSSHTLLARSYGGGTSDSDLLWQLHLRHGHRNFQDICRQYNLPVVLPG